jgi:hypothetical protein
MTEESDRTLELLQELAALKDVEDSRNPVDSVASRKRRKEIEKELKQLARSKKKSGK